MEKYLATSLDAAAWEQHGPAWIRFVKSNGFGGIVVDGGLPDEAKQKLSEVKFQVVSVQSGYTLVDQYAAALTAVKSGQWCLFAQPGEEFDPDAFVDPDRMVCREEEILKVENVVMPIANLFERAKIAAVLESNSLLSAAVLAGPERIWHQFLGVFRHILASNYVESRRALSELALNLFASQFPNSVRVVQHD